MKLNHITSRRFLHAATLATAIGLGSMHASPANAGSDAARIIAGAAALTIIGVAIAEAADNDARVTRHIYRHRARHRHRNWHMQHHRYHHRHHWHHRGGHHHRRGNHRR